MKTPLGFGKNYFSLNAITATSNMVTMNAIAIKIQSLNPSFKSEDKCEEEDLPIEIISFLKSYFYNRFFLNYTIKALKTLKNQNLDIYYFKALKLPSQQVKKIIFNKMQNRIKLFLLSMVFISQIDARDTYDLGLIQVVSSLGVSMNKKDLTDSILIITKKDIEDLRINTLQGALSKLGVIPITSNGGIGKTSSLFIRGMSTGKILILIDGVRYNDPTDISNNANFSQILLNDIERIEIIKGAQSGIWGSAASGGVINIISSKTKKGVHGSINAEYGTYNTKKNTVNVSYTTDLYNFKISVLKYYTDGFSAVEPKKDTKDYGKRFDDLGFEKDGYKNTSTNIGLGVNINNNSRLEATYRIIDDYYEFDNDGEDVDINNGENKNKFLSLLFTNKNNKNIFKTQYNLSKIDRKSTSIYLGKIGTYKFKGSIQEIKINNKFSYKNNAFLRFGISYQESKYEKITADKEDKKYSSRSIFTTNYNKIKLFSDLNTIITESIRFDSYDDFDSSTTAKLGLKQFIRDDIFISANIGSGYKAPSIYQIYSSYSGNLNLKPEISTSKDISIGNDIFFITVFQNEIRNEIAYSLSTYKFEQVNGVSIFKGIELNYNDYLLDSLGVNASYIYLDAKNTDNIKLSRRPTMQLNINAIYYFSNTFDISLISQYIGERFDNNDERDAQTGKYMLINIVANNKLNKNTVLYAKVDNVSDKYYQTVDGYATPGRSLYIGMNLKY